MLWQANHLKTVDQGFDAAPCDWEIIEDYFFWMTSGAHSDSRPFRELQWRKPVECLTRVAVERFSWPNPKFKSTSSRLNLQSRMVVKWVALQTSENTARPRALKTSCMVGRLKLNHLQTLKLATQPSSKSAFVYKFSQQKGTCGRNQYNNCFIESPMALKIWINFRCASAATSKCK